MKRKRLSKDQRQDIEVLAGMKDSEIDLTEMPEVLDWSRAEVGRYYKKKMSARAQSKRTSSRKPG
jgi:hypothetical protein